MDGWRGPAAMGPPPRSGAVGWGSIVGVLAVAGERPGDPHLGIAVGVAVAHPHNEPAAGAIERRRHVAKAHPVRIERHERATAMASELGRPAVSRPALYARAVPTVHSEQNAMLDASVTRR
jgi:hypothetical protein